MLTKHYYYLFIFTLCSPKSAGPKYVSDKAAARIDRIKQLQATACGCLFFFFSLTSLLIQGIGSNAVLLSIVPNRGDYTGADAKAGNRTAQCQAGKRCCDLCSANCQKKANRHDINVQTTSNTKKISSDKQ